MTEEPFDGDRLRRDPASFFGLADGFDVSDLRRAYHAAIRRFRPDTHPREFQRIREAHDRLARWIESGARQKEEFPRFPSGPSRIPARRRAVGSSADRARAYSELAADPGEAEDFVALALLADTLESPDRDFETWLLEGLARHPEDDGLESLLRIHVQDNVPPARVTRFLRRAATVLPHRLLWTIPTVAWETAASHLEFPRFLELWAECESPEDALDEAPRANLLAHLLPVLASRGDTAWLRSTVAWLGKRHELLRDEGATLDAVDSWMPLLDILENPVRAPSRGRRAGPDAGPDGKRVAGIPRFPDDAAGDCVRRFYRAILESRTRGGGARLAAAAREVVRREKEILASFAQLDGRLVQALQLLERAAALLAVGHPAFFPERDAEQEAELAASIHAIADARLREANSRMAIADQQSEVAARFGSLFTIALLLLGVLVGLGLAVVGRGMMRGAGYFVLVAVSAALWAIWRYQPSLLFPGPTKAKASLSRVYREHVRVAVVAAIRETGISPWSLASSDVVPFEIRNPLLANHASKDPALPILHLAYRFAP